VCNSVTRTTRSIDEIDLDISVSFSPSGETDLDFEPVFKIGTSSLESRLNKRSNNRSSFSFFLYCLFLFLQLQ
jgi:hypothetical protein